MTKMKKLRKESSQRVFPEQIEAMAKYEHDRASDWGRSCPTNWEDQGAEIKRRYKGQVIALLLEGGFIVEGKS